MTIEELQLKLSAMNLRDDYLSVTGIEQPNGLNLVFYTYNSSWRVYKPGERGEYYIDETFMELDKAIDCIMAIAEKDAQDAWYRKRT